ncbi:MAG TPA: HNH endonuclease signature motif containing protein [Anaeromyxobacteraceae bacterium]
MSEAIPVTATPPGDADRVAASFPARLASLLQEIDHFRPRQPHEHPDLFGGEASIPIDRLLTSLARGREALDLAIGEGLAALADGDGLMPLGYSKLSDYARDCLGLPASTARAMARLARELRGRPLLRDAVREGRLSARKALEVLPVASGNDERSWLLLAGTLSVRALRAAVARARAGYAPGAARGAAPGAAAGPEAAEKPWTRLSIPLRPEDRAVVDEAMRLAGELLGRGALPWQRLEAMAQEFLGSHPCDLDGSEDGGARPRHPAAEEMERLLETETRRWDWLEAVDPVAAPGLAGSDAAALDARLRELVHQRSEWDLVFGAVVRLFVRHRCSWELGFASFAHYTRERLGMGVRSVEQRVWLERRLEELPQLRYALERGELSYEKARLVAGVADGRTVNQWIRQAGKASCAVLEREVDAACDAQACARGRLEARVPARVAALVGAALRAACGSPVACRDPAGCLAHLAEHFVTTWGPALDRRNTLERRVIERDGGWCQVPGCSRPAAHAHHVRFRSQGGEDVPENMVALCEPHHLRGVHMGWVRVSGTAPDGLVWEVGGRAGVPLRFTTAAA